ncbi:MAG TPA: DUF1707 domain-containing protein [Solirubrobacteraceae bacterium]|nr:DUF1707 domain-containing protein [Solirubrobacteraceae bacterium]
MSEDLRASASGRAELRASDADRERLIDELQAHTIAGRLTTEEFEERTQAAYSARTAGDIAALRSDLPAEVTAPEVAERRRRAQLTRRLAQETGGSAGAFLVCVAVWLASGANGQFWPVWVLIPILLLLARNTWNLFGPAADLDAVEADLDRRREKRLARETGRSRERQRHLNR